MPCVIFVLAVGSVWDAEPGINELKVKVYVWLTGQTTSQARKYDQWGGGMREFNFGNVIASVFQPS